MSFRVLRDALIIIVVVTAIVFITQKFLISSFYVPSGSMEPTLLVGDRVIAEKFDKNIHRGDVIIFKDPANWLAGQSINDGYLVKRVIGLPGDKVSCCSELGQVAVNGSGLNEPYVKQGESPSDTQFDVTVPKGELWVMGDNRAESDDSRYQKEPFVPESDVVGKVVAVYWPFSSARWLQDQSIVFDGVQTAAR